MTELQRLKEVGPMVQHIRKRIDYHGVHTGVVQLLRQTAKRILLAWIESLIGHDDARVGAEGVVKVAFVQTMADDIATIVCTDDPDKLLPLDAASSVDRRWLWLERIR